MYKNILICVFSQIVVSQTTIIQSGVQLKTTKFTPFALGNKLKFWLDMTDKNKVFNNAGYTTLAANNDLATTIFSKNGIISKAYYNTTISGYLANSAAKYNSVSSTLVFSNSGKEYYPNGKAIDNLEFQLYNHTDKRTLIGIVKTNDSSTGILFGAESGASSYLNNFDVIDVQNGVIRNFYCLYSPNVSNTPISSSINSVSVLNGFNIVSLEVDPTVPATGRNFYINGQQVGVASATGVFTSPLSLFSIGAAIRCCSIAGNPRINTLTNAEIGEIIILLDVNTTSRQKLEGYVAWKWGLQSSLPSTHPYYSVAPTL